MQQYPPKCYIPEDLNLHHHLRENLKYYTTKKKLIQSKNDKTHEESVYNYEVVLQNTRCGNKETGLLLLLISGHVDDEEEGRALTRGLPSTVTQRFIHARRLVWP